MRAAEEARFEATEKLKVIHGLEQVEPPIERSILTIGNFDGVHLAHQKLIARARAIRAEPGSPVVVLTFEPHPLSVVAPHALPPRLSTLEERLRCLNEAGADVVVVAHSRPSLLELEPEAFVEDVVVRLFAPTYIVEGPSFGFGRNRRGTPELLNELTNRMGFRFEFVDPVRVDLSDGRGQMVSSSLIRRLLAHGRVEDARHCLGRPFALFGRVVRGTGRGRSLGFPTANVAPVDQLVPGDGVYAAFARIGEVDSPAAVSIGSQPTFSGGTRVIEAFVLDRDADFYDRPVRLEFMARLREQRRFDSPDALARQIDEDVNRVRASLATARDPTPRDSDPAVVSTAPTPSDHPHRMGPQE